MPGLSSRPAPPAPGRPCPCSVPTDNRGSDGCCSCDGNTGSSGHSKPQTAFQPQDRNVCSVEVVRPDWNQALVPSFFLLLHHPVNLGRLQGWSRGWVAGRPFLDWDMVVLWFLELSRCFKPTLPLTGAFMGSSEKAPQGASAPRHPGTHLQLYPQGPLGPLGSWEASF